MHIRVSLCGSSFPGRRAGATTSSGRQIAAKLSERLVSRSSWTTAAGREASSARKAAAKADPDGYTLMIAAAHHTVYAPLHDKLPFDPIKSFTPVARVGSGPNVLIVHPSVRANSVKELIALAKAKPGQLIFVSSGVGGSLHMGAELFKITADIDYKIVQFKGGGPAMIDLLGGHSQAFICSLIAAQPHIKVR